MELEVISGEIFDYQISEDKKYLIKYFKTPTELQFLRYYLLIGNTTHFSDHTGVHCTDRYLRKLKEKFKLLTGLVNKAKAEMDMTTLAVIKSGKYRVYSLKQKEVSHEE
jgi:hypothetical protein